MNTYFLLIPFIVFGMTAAFKSSDPELAIQSIQTADTLYPAEIHFVPSFIDIGETSEKFLVREVKILNKGGAPLVITGIKPSCSCASAVALNPTVNPMTSSKIRLSMNTSTMTDTLNTVQFIVESNAKNSPSVLSVFVRRPKAVLKSENK